METVREVRLNFDIDSAVKKLRDIAGYDSFGFDLEGFDKEGYDSKGFDRQGLNRKMIPWHLANKDVVDIYDDYPLF